MLENSSSLVDEEPSSTVANDFTTSTAESAATGEVIVEMTFRPDEEDGEDSGSGTTDTTAQMIIGFPLERLVMWRKQSQGDVCAMLL